MPRQDTKQAQQTEGRGRERDAYGFLKNYQEGGMVQYSPTQVDIVQGQAQLGDITFGRGANLIGGANVSAQIADLMFKGLEGAEVAAKTVQSVRDTHDKSVIEQEEEKFLKYKKGEDWAKLTEGEKAAYAATHYETLAGKVWQTENRLGYESKSLELKSSIGELNFERDRENITLSTLAIKASDLPIEQKEALLTKQIEQWKQVVDRYKDDPVLYPKAVATLYGLQIEDHARTAEAINRAFGPLTEFNGLVDSWLTDKEDDIRSGTIKDPWLDFYSYARSKGSPMTENFADEESFAQAYGSRHGELFENRLRTVKKSFETRSKSLIVAQLSSDLNDLTTSIQMTSGELSLVDFTGELGVIVDGLITTDSTGRLANDAIETVLATAVPLFVERTPVTGPYSLDELIDLTLENEVAPYLRTLDFLSVEEQNTLLNNIKTQVRRDYQKPDSRGTRVDTRLSAAGIATRTNSDGAIDSISVNPVTVVEQLPLDTATSGQWEAYREQTDSTFFSMSESWSRAQTNAFMSQNAGFSTELSSSLGLSPDFVLATLMQVGADFDYTSADEAMGVLVPLLESKGGKLTDEQKSKVRLLMTNVKESVPGMLIHTMHDGLNSDDPFALIRTNLISKANEFVDAIRNPQINTTDLVVDENGVLTVNVIPTPEELVAKAASEGDVNEWMRLSGYTPTQYTFGTILDNRETELIANSLIDGLNNFTASYYLNTPDGAAPDPEVIKKALTFLVPGLNTDQKDAITNLWMGSYLQIVTAPEGDEGAARLQAAMGTLQRNVGNAIQRTSANQFVSLYTFNTNVDTGLKTMYPELAYPEQAQALQAALSAPDNKWYQKLESLIGSENSLMYLNYLEENLVQDVGIRSLYGFLTSHGFTLGFSRVGNKINISPVEKDDVEASRVAIFSMGENDIGLITHQDKSWTYDLDTGEVGASLQKTIDGIHVAMQYGDLDQRDALALESLLRFAGSQKNGEFPLFVNQLVRGLQGEPVPAAALVGPYPFMTTEVSYDPIRPLFGNNEDAFQLARQLLASKVKRNEPFSITMEDLQIIEMEMRRRASSSSVEADQNEYYQRSEFTYPTNLTYDRTYVSPTSGQRAHTLTVSGKNIEGEVFTETGLSELFPYMSSGVNLDISPFISASEKRRRQHERATSQARIRESDSVDPYGYSALGRINPEDMSIGGALRRFQEDGRVYAALMREEYKPMQESGRRFADAMREQYRPSQKYGRLLALFARTATESMKESVRDFDLTAFVNQNIESFRESGQDLAASMREASKFMQEYGQDFSDFLREASQIDFVEYLKQNKEFTGTSGGRLIIRIAEALSEIPEDLREGVQRANQTITEGNRQALESYSERVYRNNQAFRNSFVVQGLAELLYPEQERETPFFNHYWEQRDWSAPDPAAVKMMDIATLKASAGMESEPSYDAYNGVEEFLLFDARTGYDPRVFGLSQKETAMLLDLNDKDLQMMIEYYKKYSM